MLVAGGSSGIGMAVARELLREGSRVAIAARDETALQAAAESLRADVGGEPVIVSCDTTIDSSVNSAVERAALALGRIDVLINSAARPATLSSVPLSETTSEMVRSELDTKVVGYLRCIKAVVPYMLGGGGGRIINVSGLAARTTGSAIGSIRNVAVHALTKNVADEFADQNITVVTVHPGATRTEKLPLIFSARSAQQGMSEAEVESQLAGSNLLGRIPDSSEVGKIIAFLASPVASLINGDAIAIGGGIRGAIYY